MCLIWNPRRRAGRELLFHSGATRGCTAFAAFSPGTGTAFAALANAGCTLGGSFVQRCYDTAWSLVSRTSRPRVSNVHVP